MSSEDPPPAVAKDKDLEEESVVAQETQDVPPVPPVPPRNVTEPQEIKVPTEEELEEIHGHSAGSLMFRKRNNRHYNGILLFR